MPVLSNTPGFKFAVRQWGRVHEVLAGVAGLAIAVAVGGHQSRDAKTRGIPRACGGFLTYSIMSWLETRKRYAT
ncbi:hypothetical protein [Mobiluncus mulieris]|uniref:Uncharacterized protein n=1 Tax=Mobiluncus mulieris TaxID=2052 RepID=A0A7Y0YIE3_9ACTO|nr:hypothetical protein [Mobiluncus mulieris]NMX04035.1 hypothetical protein [Mobiluncus mulieris]